MRLLFLIAWKTHWNSLKASQYLNYLKPLLLVRSIGIFVTLPQFSAVFSINTFTDINAIADSSRLVSWSTWARPVTNAIDTLAMLTDVSLILFTFIYVWKNVFTFILFSWKSFKHSIVYNNAFNFCSFMYEKYFTFIYLWTVFHIHIYLRMKHVFTIIYQLKGLSISVWKIFPSIFIYTYFHIHLCVKKCFHIYLCTKNVFYHIQLSQKRFLHPPLFENISPSVFVYLYIYEKCFHIHLC